MREPGREWCKHRARWRPRVGSRAPGVVRSVCSRAVAITVHLNVRRLSGPPLRLLEVQPLYRASNFPSGSLSRRRAVRGVRAG